MTNGQSRYAALKAMGRCTMCGKNKADRGHTTCLECRMNRREYQRGWRMGTEAKYRAEQRNKLRRDICIAFGWCVRCCKRDAKKGYTRCERCSIMEQRGQRERRHKAGKCIPTEILSDGHHCSTCGSEGLVPQKKLCPRCYQKACEALKKGRQCRGHDNNFDNAQKLYWMERNARR